MLTTNKYESWSNEPRPRSARPHSAPLSDWECFLMLVYTLMMVSGFIIATVIVKAMS